MARMIHFLAMGALLISGTVAFGQTTERSGTAARASGQSSAGVSANQNEPSASLAAGTAVNAQLTQTIDSKKAKTGETVTAQTTDAVKSDGKVIIPKGTKLVGHVTRASARSKGDADSALAIQFDRAVLKDGHEVPLQVTIQALASDQRAAAVNPDELQPAGNIEAGAAGAGTAGNRGVVGGVEIMREEEVAERHQGMRVARQPCGVARVDRGTGGASAPVERFNHHRIGQVDLDDRGNTHRLAQPARFKADRRLPVFHRSHLRAYGCQGNRLRVAVPHWRGSGRCR